MDLVLFGIQGSGKGTQAKRLAQEFGYDIFEAGGELRKIAASGSELGNTVKSYIDIGHLVPFEIIMQVVKEAILARPENQKILFDGIPRDLNQMKAFDDIMQEAGRDILCLHMLLSDEEAIKRVFGRAEQEGRADDKDEEIIRRRMSTFKEKTMPVIQSYAERGLMKEVDAAGDMETVYQEMKDALR